MQIQRMNMNERMTFFVVDDELSIDKFGMNKIKNNV